MTKETPYEYHNGKLGFKVKYLLSDDEFCHEDSLRLIKRRTLTHRMNSDTCCELRLRRSSLGFDALVEFYSLNIKWRDMITENFGEPQKQIERSYFSKHYITDGEALEFFKTYRFGDDGKRRLEPEIIELYTHNASVLNTVLKVKANRKAYAKSLNCSRVNIWESLSRDVNSFKDVTFDLPSTPGSLRHKVTQYLKNGYSSLISGKYDNANSIKVKQKEQESLLDELIAKHTNLDNELISTLYNVVADRVGWKKITAGTVANRKKKTKLITYAGRNGAKELTNNILMRNKRKRPSSSMLYWSLDGWEVELLYQDTRINSEGKTITTYHNRLVVEVVLDPYNNYPIGYAIGTHETPGLIFSALKNAIEHTEDLFGSKHKPYQLQSDNYSITKLRPLYEAITKYFTPAAVGNAKSKPVEPYFNTINKKYCKLYDNWSGFNVVTGSKNQPNSEYLNKIRHQFPDRQGCEHQIITIIETERNSKREDYIKGFANTLDKHKLPMSWVSFMQVFGSYNKTTNKLTGDGIQLTIEGAKYNYDSFDINFRKHYGESWKILYDTSNLEKVLAVSSDEKYMFELEQKHEPAMCIADRTEVDNEHLIRVNQFNKQIKTNIIEERANNYKTLDTFFADNPQLNDTVAKHLLVDSMGQHKIYKKADAKLIEKSNKLKTKQEKKQEKQEQKSFVEKQQEYYKTKIDINQYL